MCELKVFLRKEGQDKIVAEDIIYAKKVNRSIILKNILGNQVNIDAVKILEVDIKEERMVLIPDLTFIS